MPLAPPRLVDLERLLRSLRDAGFRIGVEQSLRLEAVLRQLGAAPPSTQVDFVDVVAAIVLTDATARPQLQQLVEAWVQTLAPPELPTAATPPDSTTPDDRRPPPPHRRLRLQVLGGLFLLVLLGLGWLLLFYHPIGGGHQVDGAATGELRDLGAVTLDLSTPAPDLGQPLPLLPPPHPPQVWVPTLTEQPRQIPWALWIWAAVAVISAAVGLGLWWVLRKRSYLPAPLPLPSRPGLPRVYPRAAASPHHPPLLLSRREEESAVWGIGQFVSTEKTRRLDVSRTVLATAAAAGQPRLRFQLGRHSREVWLWLDESVGSSGDGGGDEARRFVAELADTLTRAGLPLEQARFWGLPEELASDHGPFAPCEVDDRREAALVLIFTDGDFLRRALDSATDRSRTESLLRQLSHWPNLAFVDSTQGDGALSAVLCRYDLLVLLPTQIPAFLAGSSPTAALPVHGGTQLQLTGDERAWAAALALAPFPIDDQTAHLLRERLQLDVSPWLLGRLRRVALVDAAGLRFSPLDRALLLSWLVAVSEGRTDGTTRLGQALTVYRQLFLAEDLRRRQREPAEPWLSTPAEHHLRLQQALLDLWVAPTAAAETLYRLHRDVLASEIQQQLAALGPRECDGQQADGLTILPWALADQTPRTRLLLRELGLGRNSLLWRPKAESLRRPGRLPFAWGLCAGLALLSALGSLQELPSQRGEPLVRNPDAPRGASLTVHPLGAERYEVLARSDQKTAQLVVGGGAVVEVRWQSQPESEPERVDGGEVRDLAIDLAAEPSTDLATPRDLATPADASIRHDLSVRLDRATLKAWSAPPRTPGDPPDLAPAVEPSTAPPRSTQVAPCPYQEFTEPKSGVVFVKVCGGSFMMGSADDDNDASEDEKPAHPVRLDDYWIGKYEVSNQQYRKRAPNHQGRFSGAQQPVESVSWSEAQAYCKWLGGDLPTEAQWEYAARGPTNRRYPWGRSEPNADLAVFGRNQDTDQPQDIASKPRGQGPFGTFNQAGNVWEWVIDCYQFDTYEKRGAAIVTRNPVFAPAGVCSSDRRVVRGGSFNVGSVFLRTANRLGDPPRFQIRYLGFRCVRGSHRQP